MDSSDELIYNIINTLIVSQKGTGLEVSRECLMVLDEQG